MQQPHTSKAPQDLSHTNCKKEAHKEVEVLFPTQHSYTRKAPKEVSHGNSTDYVHNKGGVLSKTIKIHT